MLRRSPGDIRSITRADIRVRCCQHFGTERIPHTFVCEDCILITLASLTS